MDEKIIDIPQYFLCPISLQIMKDPVTTVTGITYDRDSIQQWLNTSAVCPVTKQPLSRPPDLTPNHMLRRLIQAWCVANAQSGIDRIPTPKSPLHKSLLIKLIRDVANKTNTLLNLHALKKLETLAQDKINQKCMAENGVAKSMLLFLLRSRDKLRAGLDHAFRILKLTWAPTEENKQIVEQNFLDLFDSILWILNSSENNSSTKIDALLVLRNVALVATSSSMERLHPCFFKEMIKFLNTIESPEATKAILKTLIAICPPVRNKIYLVEAGAVTDLIEMELNNPEKEKKTTELIFCLLANLCSMADGRQQFLGHAGAVAMVAKRLLRVSPATDDRALCILESIARFSATRGVVLEILAMGGVTKLCMLLQADCEGHLKKKARDILRLHSKVWSNSPCIQLYLFTRYTRS